MPQDDPTLADCCRRDLKEQAYVERVKQKLLEHDVTTVRSDLAHSAFVRDPACAPAALGDSDQDSLLTDSEDEEAGERRA
jgi:hypothetical protein